MAGHPHALPAVLVAFLAVGAAFPAADAIRVLGMFPFNGRSHNIMFKALMESLADRGHQVVQLSPFPQKTPRANYTDLDLSGHFPSLVNAFTYESMTSHSRFNIIKLIGELAGSALCRKVFETQHFKDIMSGKHGKFDVVFTEIFGSDCWTAVAYKLDLPLISVVTAPDFSWMHERVGSVDNPAYLITSNEPLVGRLSLAERAWNLGVNLASNYMHKVYVNNAANDAVVREFFGADTPPVSELVKRTSLIMVNRHASIHPARPVNPNVLHVGGLHLKDAKPDRTGAGLEPGLRRWMDAAEHGVVFFSLGSLVRSSTLPPATIAALLAAFAALPQRVLWKFEDTAIKLPANVRTASWLPQMDVLAHPKTILFITHGGLMGTMEAVYLGVPMLGIPLFADQLPNVMEYTALGIAEGLSHDNLTEENVHAAIRKLTATDKYRVRAKELAALFSDRPATATNDAIWWTEYVVRNKGARHLRPLGADMPLYEYLLLDVVALFLAIVVAILVLVGAVARALLRRLLAKAAAPAEERKKKKKH